MLMTSKEVQSFFGISRMTLYRHMAEEGFPKIKVGRQWRFDKEELLEYYRNK